MARQRRLQKRQREMLDRAWGHVRSVPYVVSLRWLFYRLLADGTYTDKGGYTHCKKHVAMARRTFHEGWRPWTLSDDTREPIYRGRGYQTARAWLKELIYPQGAQIDRWRDQPNYVELWFEARAMRAQFEHYTQNITLRPFGGSPSIAFKWTIVSDLKTIMDRFPDKHIVILYFGDSDDMGFKIPINAVNIMRYEWGCVNFEFVRVGLNEGDGEQLGMFENPDRPGSYQWEGLTDVQARKIITGAVEQYVDFEIMEATVMEENQATDQFRNAMDELIDRWEGE